MNLLETKALFIADDEGVLILTDIADKPDITFGEVVYDGKNVAVLNRDNQEYYVLENIQPELRESMLHASNVTVIERRGNDDLYAYSLRVRTVKDMGLDDHWEEHAENVIEELRENLSEGDFAEVVKIAEKDL